MRVLALAGYDSFLNIASLIAPHFRDAGCSFDYALVRARSKKQISQEQIDRLGVGGDVAWVSIKDICLSGEIGQYDIILSSLEGLSTRRLAHYLAALGERRPMLISVYPGLVLRYAFDGYAMRTAGDLVWLNCQADLESYQQMCRAFGLDASGARVFGVAALLQKVEREPARQDGPVAFFEQAVIPRYHDERLFLAEQLVGLARRFPTRSFVVKPRTTGSAATLHQTWHPIEPLLTFAAEQSGGWPDNLAISSESASHLLCRASHCLTVSSTVAVEAISAGVPTTIIGDFGAHDDYGLAYFFESGLIRTFAELTFPMTDSANPDWFRRRVADPCISAPGLVAEAVNLARQPRRPLTDRLLRAEMSTELRSFLVARNGVDAVLARKYQVKTQVGATQRMYRFIKRLFD